MRCKPGVVYVQQGDQWCAADADCGYARRWPDAYRATAPPVAAGGVAGEEPALAVILLDAAEPVKKVEATVGEAEALLLGQAALDVVAQGGRRLAYRLTPQTSS
ncbi:MAG TPA: hypothetical protein VNG90_01135, partial [Candidatus Acidoferrum sp.]|nr:hypothetical protein [Candidatus Acidoferrum sp.]